jgi:choline-sulfatase
MQPIIFTSDHADLLGSHAGMHQKWYTAYEEAIRVPLIVTNQRLFRGPGTLDRLTSHVDLLPTMLGIAGLDPASIQEKLAVDQSDVRPLVGRDLSAIASGMKAPDRQTMGFIL